MRSTCSSDCGVMWSQTSRNGRCVVASATRRPGVASIMTTRGVPVAAARNSVWPLNGTPASLMMPLCTGPVTRPATRPAVQAATAASSVAST